MKKHLPILILIAALLLAPLASCAGGNSPGETGGESDTGTAAQAPETGATETDAPETNAPETNAPETNASTDDTNTPPESGAEPGTTAEPSDDVMSDPKIKELTYVALGDSIAAGYALANPETERFSTLLETYLDKTGTIDCTSYNYGVNGQTSAELLDSLKSGTAPELEKAQLVTISIGANNVLAPSVELLTQYSINLLIEDADARAAANAAIYNKFVTQTEDGIKQFADDLPGIIAAVRNRAPDAQIIFETIYNPYKGVPLKLDFGVATFDISETADKLVSRLNEIIDANSDKLGYDVADVYTAFSQENDVVNADAGSSGSLLTGLDPHPNAKGHRLIADTIFPLIRIPGEERP